MGGLEKGGGGGGGVLECGVVKQMRADVKDEGYQSTNHLRTFFLKCYLILPNLIGEKYTDQKHSLE